MAVAKSSRNGAFLLDYRLIVSVSVKMRSVVTANMRSVRFRVPISSENGIIGVVKAGVEIAGIIVTMPNGAIEIRLNTATKCRSLIGYGKAGYSQKAY
ncbi:MAG: hypothetical protein A2145_05960 [candidate division Zixibacteria bacterium RBG_16_40_9]|nr:MAG: hypothetical protein A2145_05960 [candidate division Zixibacteria bacterium RBG_16_40_9]